jgi:hypothetical protein
MYLLMMSDVPSDDVSSIVHTSWFLSSHMDYYRAWQTVPSFFVSFEVEM